MNKARLSLFVFALRSISASNNTLPRNRYGNHGNRFLFPHSLPWRRYLLLAGFVLGTSGWAFSTEAVSPGSTQPAIPLRIRSWMEDNVENPIEPFELVPGKPASDWAFKLEPYGWLPAFDSNLAIRNFPPIGFRLSPIQVLEKLDWGIFMAGEVRKGRWGVMADGMYAQFSASGNSQNPLYKSASVQFQQSITSLALAFRVIDRKSGYLDFYAGGRAYYLGVDASAQLDANEIQHVAEAGADRVTSQLSQYASELIKENVNISADALAEHLKSGISERVLDRVAENSPEIKDLIKIKKKIEGLDPNLPAIRDYLRALAQEKVAQAAGKLTPALQQKVASAKQNLANETARRLEDRLPLQVAKSQWWIDPIIGFRSQWNFTHWLYLNTQADVGGFGAGSQIAWFVQSALGFNLTRNTSLELGYRYLYFNYVGSQLSLESNLPGVYAGVIFRF